MGQGPLYAPFAHHSFQQPEIPAAEGGNDMAMTQDRSSLVSRDESVDQLQYVTGLERRNRLHRPRHTGSRMLYKGVNSFSWYCDLLVSMSFG
jgi:hypothetical protein